MRIYTKLVICMDTLELLEEHSFEYRGPLALCDSGESEGESEGEPSPGEPGGGLGGLAGAQSGEGGEIGEESEAATEGGEGHTPGGPSMEGLAGSETGLTDREMGLAEAGELDFSTLIENMFYGFSLGLPFGGLPGGLVGMGLAGAGTLASQGQLGNIGIEGPGPAQTPDTSDTGETTAGGDRGGFGGTSEAGTGRGPAEPAPGGLLSSEIPGDELDEEEETLGRGRRATQTLLTGGRGLLSPARTRRRTLLSA